MKKIVFSTDDLPPGLDERKRRSLWLDRYLDLVGPADVAFLADRPLSVRFNFLPTGSLGIGEYEGTMASVSRNSRQAAAISAPVYHLTYNTGDALWSSDIGKREAILQRGTLLLFDPDLPNTFRASDAGSWRGLQIPKHLLRDRVPGVDDLVCTALPDTVTTRILKGYMDLLCTEPNLDEDPTLSAHLDTTLLDLASLALGATRDLAEGARLRGLRAARLHAILAAVQAGFSDPAFSSDQVAQELGVSRRYVNDLLQETGRSLTERVLELRLQKARAMLTGPRHDWLKVSDIALACGFNEVSYFNRCFRRRFGASPTQYRGGNGHDTDGDGTSR